MIRIGIICPSEIAYRRFMPALDKLEGFSFVGVAIANLTEWEGSDAALIAAEKDKATSFISDYGGKIFDSYSSLIYSEEVDAIYMPLPPALHFHWAEKALKAGKHVLVEKPATISLEDTSSLVQLATEKKLALHENYMFVFHQQLTDLESIVQSGKIGAVRLYRLSFGFPRRNANDFRYNKALGGGALLDAGGYTIKYASMLLGKSTKLATAHSQFVDDFEVDISGSATLVNDEKVVAQIAFGMDNSYKCDLEVWGSKGTVKSGRVFTAPEGFIPEATVQVGTEITTSLLSEDDAFMKSIAHFKNCIVNAKIRKDNYTQIIQQATLVDEFIAQTHL